MDWEALKTAVHDAAEYAINLGKDRCNDIDVIRVIEEDTESDNDYIIPPYIQYRIDNPVGLGVDEVRSVDASKIPSQPAGTPDHLLYDCAKAVCGLRTITVTYKVETDCQGLGRGSARELIETLRTRFRRPDVRAILNTGDLSLSRIGATVDIPLVVDGRQYSYASVEITLNAICEDVPFGAQKARKAGISICIDGEEVAACDTLPLAPLGGVCLVDENGFYLLDENKDFLCE